MKKTLATVALSAMLICFPLTASAQTITDPHSGPFGHMSEGEIAQASQQALNFLTHDYTGPNTDPHGGAGYTGNRTVLFGKAWEDVDGNKCDTRNDILTRDLVDADYDKDTPGIQGIEQGVGKGVSSCKNATVYSGTLHDPYTGNTIDFVRGPKTSSKVQIDHVIPLGYAYLNGGWDMAQQGKKDIMVAFANDPLNLIAVDGPTNGSKSDSGPSQWRPPIDSPAMQCQYDIRVIQVAQKYQPYGLALAQEDADYLTNSLTSCVTQFASQAEQTPVNPSPDPSVAPSTEPSTPTEASPEPNTPAEPSPTAHPESREDAKKSPDSNRSSAPRSDNPSRDTHGVGEKVTGRTLANTGANSMLLASASIFGLTLGSVWLAMRRPAKKGN